MGGKEAPTAGPDVSRTFTDGDGVEAGAASGSTAGLEPQLDHLRNVVALIWRSMVLWMMLVALLSLANLIG